MASQRGFDELPHDIFHDPLYSWCCYEPSSTHPPLLPVLGSRQIHPNGLNTRGEGQVGVCKDWSTPNGARAHEDVNLLDGRDGRMDGWDAGLGHNLGFLEETARDLDSPGPVPSQTPLPSLLSDSEKKSTDTTKPCSTVSYPQTEKKQLNPVYSLSKLFFLVSTANDLNVFVAPHKERFKTWSEVQHRLKEKGYDCPINSLKRKLEELVFYHMDPDSKKVTKATRDLFMTESAQVRFGASLDALKNCWDLRKASDGEKVKEQKKKEENHRGGVYLRDAMKRTMRQNTDSESTDDAGQADSSFNAADDELSTSSDKGEDKENVRKQTLKRKAHVLDPNRSDDDYERVVAKNVKRLRRTNSTGPSFDWDKYLKEEHEARTSFEVGLMERLDKGNKHNEDMMMFMQNAHKDNCTFQNGLLELLSRKL